MNKMMIGHQRNILAALGIDLWVPKDAPRQEKRATSIWRDQNQDHPVAAASIVRDIHVAAAIAVPVAQPIPRDVASENPAIAVEIDAVPAMLPERPAMEQLAPIAPFHLQAFSLAHCVVVAETTALTEQQQQLWFNIQSALPGQYHELKWPFPLLNLQDARGVSSYIQGFLDAMGSGKTLISLGDLPYFQYSRLTRLASLQEMLEQPLLKKRLWQFMQNNDEKMED